MTNFKLFIFFVCLYRFEGNYPWFESMARKMPSEGKLNAVDEYLEVTEVHSRISKVLHAFRIFDLHTLDWDADFSKLGIDSFEVTAILTSIEHEFHTVFEDRVFENMHSLNEVKERVTMDHNCF